MVSKVLRITSCQLRYFVFSVLAKEKESTKGVLRQEGGSLLPLCHEYQRRCRRLKVPELSEEPLHSRHEHGEAPGD